VAFAAGITVLVCAVIVILYVTHFAENKIVEKRLRVTIPENLDYNGLLDDLFETYTKKHRMEQVKTANMGSLYDVSYLVELKDESREKEFLDEIRCRNGNLTVVCGRCDYRAAEEL
jgi:hypothetical protein